VKGNFPCTCESMVGTEVTDLMYLNKEVLKPVTLSECGRYMGKKSSLCFFYPFKFQNFYAFAHCKEVKDGSNND